MLKIRLAALALGGLMLSGCASGWTPEVAAPAIASKTFNVKDFGAVGDGKTMNTKALQGAVDACVKAGGGVVEVPAGKYLTAAFTLGNGVDLNLEKDAIIIFSDKMDDYAITNNRYENFISATDCHDVAVTGEGTIDGQGEVWWKEFKAKKTAMPHRPFLVVFTRCQRVLVEGVTLHDSPMEHLVPKQSQDVMVRNVTITVHDPLLAKNTDGVDPSGRNIVITHCTLDTGDDNVAVKPTDRYDPSRPAVENLLISDCTCLHGHGISIGGQSYGGMSKMVVRNCTFDGTDAGIRAKAPRSAGGLVEDLTYENLTMKNVTYAISITSYYPESSAPKDLHKAEKREVTASTPIWRHIRISNVTATDGQYAGRILGLPEMPISDVVLENVHLSAQKPLTITQANGVVFQNSTVQVESGKPVVIVDAEVTGIDADSGK
jgi:polygalacturonase